VHSAQQGTLLTPHPVRKEVELARRRAKHRLEKFILLDHPVLQGPLRTVSLQCVQMALALPMRNWVDRLFGEHGGAVRCCRMVQLSRIDNVVTTSNLMQGVADSFVQLRQRIHLVQSDCVDSTCEGVRWLR